jgi:sigma-E factor negative regulatory protein RseB
MRIVSSKERLGWIAWALAATSVALAEEPAKWLERMNQALTQRNYDGTFSHWHGGRVDMLRIIHRVERGTVSERLVSLDGSGREFIRTGSDLACYLPDKKTVLVERRPAQESLLGNFPVVNDSTSDYYDIREVAQTRLNRRDTHVIAITPKDAYRYGYRLWIDDRTAMPIKTQLCDGRGQVMEQLVFASLTLSTQIPDAAFKPDVSTTGFQWLRNDMSTLAPPAAQAVLSGVLKLPPGFRMTARSSQLLPGAQQPASHLVFTDGMASVSVFVEDRPSAPGQQSVGEESARLGSSSVYSVFVDGRKVTAVGEVPLETARSIASSFLSSNGAHTLETGRH